MAILKGVQVRIQSSSSKLLEEYEPLVGMVSMSSRNTEKFIEAITDVPFAIHVQLARGFDFPGGDGVLIRYTIDDGAIINQNLGVAK
jgi:hypothetical protein